MKSNSVLEQFDETEDSQTQYSSYMQSEFNIPAEMLDRVKPNHDGFPKDRDEESFINDFDHSKKLRLDFYDQKMGGAKVGQNSEANERSKTREKNMNWKSKPKYAAGKELSLIHI